MSKIIVLLAAALALIGSFRVNAAEVTYVLENGVDGYEGVDDTSIFSESTNSGGGSTGIFSGTNAQLNLRRALIRFELTPIPANATILDVTLSLTVDRSGGNNSNNPFGLHRVQQAWGEGDVVGASQGGFGGSPDDGDATWTSSSHGNTLWTAPGGDFITGASASATSGQADSVTEWNSATMAADVQAWLAAPDTNFGWLLLSTQEGTLQIVKRFLSSESVNAKPRLTVVANIPPPAGADINGDLAFDAVDVQLVINAALGIDIEGLDADVNDDTLVTAVDVQIVINAALGI